MKEKLIYIFFGGKFFRIIFSLWEKYALRLALLKL